MKRSLEEIVSLFYEQFADKGAALEWDDVEQFADKYHLVFDSGETRYCLFQEHWNEVLKIPRLDNVEDDYGQIELDNYNKACDLGIERILLACRKVCVLPGGCSIYAQVKFTKSHSRLERHECRKLENIIQKVRGTKICYAAKNGMFDSYRIREDWFIRAYQIYGKKFMRVLETFTRENRIGDLHASNIGWLGKMPVILDYAGYHG